MPGEADLAHGRENADPCRMRGPIGVLHEYRLGEIEFPGTYLHAIVLERIGIEDHCEWITLKAGPSEHVEHVVGKAHQRIPSWRAPCRILFELFKGLRRSLAPARTRQSTILLVVARPSHLSLATMQPQSRR